MNAMFIIYTKAQIAKQSSHFGKTEEIVELFSGQSILLDQLHFSEHYSRVEFLPETSSYVDAGAPLDLKKIYVYFTLVAFGGLFILLLILENIYVKERIINFVKCVHCRKGSSSASECTDDDVKDEHKLTELVVKENQIDDYPIVVSNLQKRYGNVGAVNGINFTVKKGECFGLLGMNGAGKKSNG